MNDYTMWVLGQADAPSQVSSEPVGAPAGGVQSKTTAADANAAGTAAPAKGPQVYSQFILIGLMVVLFYFLFFRGPQKQKQQHQKMVAALKKNDKVRTIGGIIGTIVDINGDVITLKVDESNNTKIKVVSSAIGKSLSDQTD